MPFIVKASRPRNPVMVELDRLEGRVAPQSKARAKPAQKRAAKKVPRKKASRK